MVLGRAPRHDLNGSLSMLLYWLAFAAFLIGHSVPTRAGPRAALVQRLGERGFALAYSLLSTLLLLLLLLAAIQAPYVALFAPPAWAATATLVLAPLGLVIATVGLARPNPLSFSFARQAFDPERPGIVALTRHPVLLGLALWALGHAVARGDVVGLTLFGGLGIFAVAGFWLVDRRFRRTLGAEAWDGLAARYPRLSVMGAGVPRPDRSDAIGFAIGLLLVAVLLLGGHAALFGFDPLALP